MDSYNVFYCWQSDYNWTKTTNLLDDQKRESLSEQISQKVFIQRELESLAYNLGKGHKCNIIVDYDTDETPGMQPISDVVVEKIKKCHIFVCDLTPVTTINVNGRIKCMPNSNVMFELGVALSLLQPQQIIAIANKKEDYWNPKDLPFDIAHRQIITFTNSNDLDLKSALESSLKYLKSMKVKWSGYLKRISNKFKPTLKKKSRINELATLYNPEEFFKSRMAMAFPGIRGLMPIDINKLNVFFKDPITNVDVTPMLLIDKFGEHPIKQYKVLKKSIWFRMAYNDNGQSILIGDTEVSNPKIYVYRSISNPVFNFLLIESQVKENKEQNTEDNIFEENEVKEYAILNGNRNISKEEYEDGYIFENSKSYYIRTKSEFRRRYLKNNCLIIVPNNSGCNRNFFYLIFRLFICNNKDVKKMEGAIQEIEHYFYSNNTDEEGEYEDYQSRHRKKTNQNDYNGDIVKRIIDNFCD